MRRRAAAAARAPASASPNSRARPHPRHPLPVTCRDAPRNSLGMRRPAAPRASPPRSLSSRALQAEGEGRKGTEKSGGGHAACLCFFHLHSLGAHGHAPLLSLAELMTPCLVHAHTVRAVCFGPATFGAARAPAPAAHATSSILQTHSRAPTHCAGAARVRWLLHQTPCVLFFLGQAPRRLSFIGRKGGAGSTGPPVPAAVRVSCPAAPPPPLISRAAGRAMTLLPVVLCLLLMWPARPVAGARSRRGGRAWQQSPLSVREGQAAAAAALLPPIACASLASPAAAAAPGGLPTVVLSLGSGAAAPAAMLADALPAGSAASVVGIGESGPTSGLDSAHVRTRMRARGRTGASRGLRAARHVRAPATHGPAARARPPPPRPSPCCAGHRAR